MFHNVKQISKAVFTVILFDHLNGTSADVDITLWKGNFNRLFPKFLLNCKIEFALESAWFVDKRNSPDAELEI